MPVPQRLPIVNGDDGQWGDILDQYLKKEHYDDGTDNAVNGGHKTVTVRAGTAAAGTAPIKLTSGTVLSSPEAGAVEFNTDGLYFTITTGAVRRTIAMYDDGSGATGDTYYRNSSGLFTRLGVGSTSDVLTVSGGLPSWQALPTASTATSGITQLATFGETTTGTSTVKTVTPSGLSHSDFGMRVMQILVSDPNGSAISTGNGKAYVVVPAQFNGYKIVTAHASVTTVSSSGNPTIQIYNVTNAVNTLSTAISIDANETTSYTAATPPVVDSSNNTVATGDSLRIDISTAGTGTKGLIVIIGLQLP